MRIKLLTGTAAMAAGLGLSALTPGIGIAEAAASAPPPPCQNCQSGPNTPQDNHNSPDQPWMQRGNGGIIPPSGGGPESGGRSVQQ